MNLVRPGQNRSFLGQVTQVELKSNWDNLGANLVKLGTGVDHVKMG